MLEIYKKIGNYTLIRSEGLFGLSDQRLELLLPCEYDSIFHEGGGFIITKNSKSGYIRFREEIPPHDEYETVCGFPEKCAEQYLPCIYDRIEPTRNGLILYSMTADKYASEKRAWFDYKSGKLYEELHFLKNHGEYDEFIDMDRCTPMKQLRRSGDDFYIFLSMDLLYEVPVYSGLARYFVCSEELTDEEAEEKGYGYEYFFMIVLPDSYTFTEPKSNLKEIFDYFPQIITIWEKRAEAEQEHMKLKKGIKNI